MKVLVACEESQTVCKAFRARGHEAYSSDIQEPSGGHPEWHILGDVRNVLEGMPYCPIRFETMDGKSHELLEWDMVIAFPPCTDLAVSGARWFEEKRKDGRQQQSIAFFLNFACLPSRMKVAIENPIGIMSTIYRKPDQIIQPWQFGHGETKATCLWLQNLPPLEPTNIVDGREQRVWRMGPSKDRAKNRSKTFQGIADAMAEQWGSLEVQE